jgi:hypothetical protein
MVFQKDSENTSGPSGNELCESFVMAALDAGVYQWFVLLELVLLSNSECATSVLPM